MIETGILFDNIHSFYDLNLILSGCDIPPATPKTNYVDIPGADGSVDLTEAHGEVRFKDRTCQFTFTMKPDDPLTWEEKKSEIENLLNGRKVTIILDKDSDFYYTGRCTVSDFSSSKKIRQIVVSATVSPYKMKLEETVLEYELSETPQTICIQNSRKTVSPFVVITGTATLTFGNSTYQLTTVNANYRIPDLWLVMGENYLTISGTGTITFRFREGAL